MSDAVILLDHRVTDQVSTRRLRVVKYRGSHHGTNEYPFLIDRHGLSVLPVTSLGLTHEASVERLSSGVRELDQMLGGHGYFRGSTVLVSGTAGTGKTSLSAHFADAACRRGERVLYFLSRSPRTSSYATCGRLASICNPGPTRTSCVFRLRARPARAWRHTWPPYINTSATSGPL